MKSIKVKNQYVITDLEGKIYLVDLSIMKTVWGNGFYNLIKSYRINFESGEISDIISKLEKNCNDITIIDAVDIDNY